MLYDEFGDALVHDFAGIAEALEKRLASWGADEGTDTDEAEEGETASAPNGLPEKKRKKLLDPKTWARDARLVSTAERLAGSLGRDVFPDHNVFRERADQAVKELGMDVSSADLKLILRTVSWRDEAAPPVIDKFLKEKSGTAPSTATR